MPVRPVEARSIPGLRQRDMFRDGEGHIQVIPIVAVSVFGGLLLFLTTYYTLRHLRFRYDNPKYLPSFLKPIWKSWNVRRYAVARDDTAHLEPISERTGRSVSFGDTGHGGPTNTTAQATGGAGVDRQQSVRSIMTLPPYSHAPQSHETVLGREGERAGIDTVVSFPDIAEQAEEERREEEQEALYQVRLARREEAAAREDRRRLRAEARARGDTEEVERLRREREESSARLDALRTEHERAKERRRAVSSVSYEGLGVARHDGSRIRANSEESERPLLEDSASMAFSNRDPRASTGSFDTMRSDLEEPSPGFTRGHRYSNSGARSPLMMEVGGGSGADDDDAQGPPLYETISLGNGPEGPPVYTPSIGAPRQGSTSRSPAPAGLGLSLARSNSGERNLTPPTASSSSSPKPASFAPPSFNTPPPVPINTATTSAPISQVPTHASPLDGHPVMYARGTNVRVILSPESAAYRAAQAEQSSADAAPQLPDLDFDSEDGYEPPLMGENGFDLVGVRERRTSAVLEGAGERLSRLADGGGGGEEERGRQRPPSIVVEGATPVVGRGEGPELGGAG